jgi:hypothetical protein
VSWVDACSVPENSALCGLFPAQASVMDLISITERVKNSVKNLTLSCVLTIIEMNMATEASLKQPALSTLHHPSQTALFSIHST